MSAKRGPGRLSAALAIVGIAGCGGGGVAAVATSGTTGANASGYATTPASAGTVNPAAIPLGDGYVSTLPKVGYIDSCMTTFGGQGGAQAVGPWINTAKKAWDSSTKIAVSGSVTWPRASYRVRTSGTSRLISFDDLPISHTTGVFPVAGSDAASAYDRNPNRITAKKLTWKLARTPRAAGTPGCTGGGAIGVLNDGVILYNALDGEGRDAGAHEVLDRCAGHPDMSSTYHHHDIPPCILAKATAASTLVGYALDGYGIYVERSAGGALPTNTDLDACHGRTSSVLFNGRRQSIYHYVATTEYPYSVGCFHGKAATVSTGGGGHGGGRPPGH